MLISSIICDDNVKKEIKFNNGFFFSSSPFDKLRPRHRVYVYVFGRQLTFFAFVLVATGALGRGPQLLVLGAGETDVLRLVRPFDRNHGCYVPGPLVLPGRIGAATAAGPATAAGAHHRLLQLAVGRRRPELVLGHVVVRRRPGRLLQPGTTVPA